MNILQLITKDISQGKNIDLYGTILVALFVIPVNLLGLTSPTLISSLTLAVLAIILVTLLGERNQHKEQFRINEELRRHGLVQAFSNLQDAKIDDRHRVAQHEIRILTTWLPDWNPLSPELVNAIKRDIPVQILLLDPGCEMRVHRVRASQYISDDSTSSAIERIVSTAKRYHLQNHSNLEIRLYDTLPPFYLRMIDDWMLVGLYWYGHGSSQGPLFAVQGASSSFGRYILETFGVIWKTAKPLSLETQ